ncbi:MAG: exodeoxyribonuclease III [Planctomycetota bacterium]
MKIATWNVNSIRARLGRVTSWLDRHRPDVLCMQETKVEDEAFPVESFTKVGYEVAFHGERGRNGVAIASRHPMDERRHGWSRGGGRGGPVGAAPHESGDRKPEDEARLLSVKVLGIDLATVYVPNGQAVGAEAYFEKIQWLVKLRMHLATGFDPKKPFLICGDFNIAPEDKDIWDVRLRAGLHCSKAERDALGAMLAWGLKDTLRMKTQEGGVFSWWFYTPTDFKKNKGMRIDLLLATEPLAARLLDVTIDKEERGRQGDRREHHGAASEKPSDHAPVVASFSG